MADVITRFKLETTQYESALRDATKWLKDVVHQTELAGNDFKEFSNRAIEAARALGQQATGATNAKDKVKELVSSYNEMAKTYNLMSDAMKKSEGGKALSASLQQLQQRINDAKAEMNATPGVLDKLASKFTVNVDAIKLFNIGLQAAEGALQVAKDAFMSSEANVDEWGRVIDSSKSLYEGFLTALNTGDISGYLGRIDEIVQAARTAYDELDRLGTMKTIQAPKMSAQQTENERMRMMIQTGRYIAPVDGRKASMQNGQLLTPDQIKRIEQQLQGGMQKVVTLVGNEVAQTGRAIDAVYNRQAQELGMSLKEFRKGTSSMAEFDKRMAGYDQYQKWREQHTTIDLQSGRETVARGNPFEQFAKWGTFRVDGQRYNDLVKLIQQRDQQAVQAYSMQSQAYRTMNRAEGVTLRQIMGGGSGGGGGRSGKVGSSKGFDISSIAFDANKAALAAAMSEGDDTSDVWKALTEGSKESKNSIEELTEALEALNKAEGITASGSDNKPNNGDKKRESTANDIRSVAEGVGSMVSGLNQLGIELPAGLSQLMGGVQAFISILSGIASIVAVIAGIQAAKATPVIGWLLARGGTNRNGRIIHAATGYTVPGNFMSGDQVPAMLNSGETVLNKAQTAHLENELTNNQPRAMRVNGRISGHDIVLAADRSLAQEGKGHIVTWK